MLRYTLVLIFPLLNYVAAQDDFAPQVTATCAVVENSTAYMFTVEMAADGGAIFINSLCEAQSTLVSGNYTFAADSCTEPGPIPPLGTAFILVVQKFPTINLLEDSRFNVTCSLDLSEVEMVVILNITGEGEADDGTTVAKIAPTLDVGLVGNTTGTPLSSGNVGDPVKLVISVPSEESTVFDFQILILEVSAGADTVTMIDEGCSLYLSIIQTPSLPVDGKLEVSFELFIPRNTSATPSLPGTGATVVTYRFTLGVCDFAEGRCELLSCGDTGRKRRKRSITSNSTTTETVEVAASYTVYPTGHTRRTNPNARFAQEEAVVDNVCLAKTSFIGLLLGLLVVLAVCVGIGACMFCRLRRRIHKGSEKNAFKNEGFNSFTK